MLAEASFAGHHGPQPAGTIDDNLFVNDVVAVSFGNGQRGRQHDRRGDRVAGRQRRGGRRRPWARTAWGEGFEIGNTKPGAGLLVEDNVFTGDTQHAKPAIQLTLAAGTYNPSVTVGLNDLTVENNVINGWYVGIETDTSFVDGGTGLYALNNLKVLNNEVVNSSSKLVRHDGAYSAAQEQWSGNQYYDTGLSPTNSSWFSVQGNALTFSQWSTGIEGGTAGILPTALTPSPFADPTRSIATYDATVGTAGTVADFLAGARALSPENFQPQYMAAAASAYVAAGFALDATPPTAVAQTTNVNATAIGRTSYTFTVTYTDDVGLNAATLGSGNVLVTGPNGVVASALSESAGTATVGAGGYQSTVVTYTVTAPNGGWAAGQDGTYSVSVLPNQVKDKAGNAVAAGVVGTFAVDLTPPTASISAANLPAVNPTSPTYTFGVTYADASGIDASTLTNGQVQVTGPNGYAQYGTIGTETGNADGSLTVTYTVAAPNGGTWGAAAGTYAIAVSGGVISDLAGNTLVGTALASFAAGGATAATGSVTGYVFNDANGNGTFDPRETPMVGVTLFVDLNGTGVYAANDPTAVTTATGAYTFTSLPVGRYTIVELPPTGYAGVTTAVVNVTANTAVVANFADAVSTVVFSGSTTAAPAPSGSAPAKRPSPVGTTTTVPVLGGAATGVPVSIAGPTWAVAATKTAGVQSLV